eukprot:TRINITY_DN22546_c0_g1_i1.p1 TRINITY_DN22546_c0_g1~~TRINITY_DN22546_c0_g1_i1.p1  ORF type:complete len:1668 (+),score=530.91 TRINITY_DN22546_c0_g1_i1:174-5177(+)
MASRASPSRGGSGSFSAARVAAIRRPLGQGLGGRWSEGESLRSDLQQRRPPSQAAARKQRSPSPAQRGRRSVGKAKGGATGVEGLIGFKAEVEAAAAAAHHWGRDGDEGGTVTTASASTVALALSSSSPASSASTWASYALRQSRAAAASSGGYSLQQLSPSLEQTSTSTASSLVAASQLPQPSQQPWPSDSAGQLRDLEAEADEILAALLGFGAGRSAHTALAPASSSGRLRTAEKGYFAEELPSASELLERAGSAGSLSASEALASQLRRRGAEGGRFAATTASASQGRLVEEASDSPNGPMAESFASVEGPAVGSFGALERHAVHPGEEEAEAAADAASPAAYPFSRSASLDALGPSAEEKGNALASTEDWLSRYSAPAADSACLSYPSAWVDIAGAATSLAGGLPAEELPVEVLSRAREAVENGQLLRMALAAYHNADSALVGYLPLQGGALHDFVVSIFNHYNLPPPMEAQIYEMYTFFDLERRTILQARECLCLVDALFRASVYASAGGAQLPALQGGPRRSLNTLSTSLGTSTSSSSVSRSADHPTALAQRWVVDYKALPMAGTVSVTYSSGVIVSFADYASSLAGLAAANVQQREAMVQAIESGDLMRGALSVYMSRFGAADEGRLGWESGAICDYVVAVFQSYGLNPPTSSQIYNVYRKFTGERGAAPLNTSECLCLTDALFRALFHIEIRPSSLHEFEGLPSESTVDSRATSFEARSAVVVRGEEGVKQGSNGEAPPAACSSPWETARAVEAAEAAARRSGESLERRWDGVAEAEAGQEACGDAQDTSIWDDARQALLEKNALVRDLQADKLAAEAKDEEQRALQLKLRQLEEAMSREQEHREAAAQQAQDEKDALLAKLGQLGKAFEKNHTTQQLALQDALDERSVLKQRIEDLTVQSERRAAAEQSAKAEAMLGTATLEARLRDLEEEARFATQEEEERKFLLKAQEDEYEQRLQRLEADFEGMEAAYRRSRADRTDLELRINEISSSADRLAHAEHSVQVESEVQRAALETRINELVAAAKHADMLHRSSLHQASQESIALKELFREQEQMAEEAKRARASSSMQHQKSLHEADKERAQLEEKLEDLAQQASQADRRATVQAQRSASLLEAQREKEQLRAEIVTLTESARQAQEEHNFVLQTERRIMLQKSERQEAELDAKIDDWSLTAHRAQAALDEEVHEAAREKALLEQRIADLRAASDGLQLLSQSASEDREQLETEIVAAQGAAVSALQQNDLLEAQVAQLRQASQRMEQTISQLHTDSQRQLAVDAATKEDLLQGFEKERQVEIFQIHSAYEEALERASQQQLLWQSEASQSRERQAALEVHIRELAAAAASARDEEDYLRREAVEERAALATRIAELGSEAQTTLGAQQLALREAADERRQLEDQVMQLGDVAERAMRAEQDAQRKAAEASAEQARAEATMRQLASHARSEYEQMSEERQKLDTSKRLLEEKALELSEAAARVKSARLSLSQGASSEVAALREQEAALQVRATAAQHAEAEASRSYQEGRRMLESEIAAMVAAQRSTSKASTVSVGKANSLPMQAVRSVTLTSPMRRAGHGGGMGQSVAASPSTASSVASPVALQPAFGRRHTDGSSLAGPVRRQQSIGSAALVNALCHEAQVHDPHQLSFPNKVGIYSTVQGYAHG